MLTDIDPSLGLEVSQENQEKSLEQCNTHPPIGVPGTDSMEIGVSVDQRRHGFQCCVHPADRALLVCVSVYVPVHGLEVGDPWLRGFSSHFLA